ncbi:hypothetical protein TVAG_303040 [Trichomonas vaginalis G3]|uniref:Uncharacterized protein n=1 Tax=Trichomonas vaginalis (strain ATCC PRA-98 / G3) TaxID=412133 RepID=A2FZ04_TRIV3|nr:hypothetical protein TVAGG3_0220260 [Trichomonas vaginalis G3]EAX89867.1 hypothetical protein TVAG_303040 [Trichomonas vaginalis G3]KAI5551875.1 hypothetical protein TVAGG3_0220260 [Trichomonas vaginalis G3]|eukprot:XP_001302797.1 hypothetical protein [Trichomonas vaginalis G3]
MLLSLINVRIFVANFASNKMQKEWLLNQQRTELSFRECSASTADLPKVCAILSGQKTKIEQKLIQKNIYSYGQELWVHFTAKSTIQKIPSEIYFTAYDNLENSIFSAGLSFFQASLAFFNHSSSSTFKTFIWNPEYTHSIDVAVKRDGNTSLFVDNKLVMQTKFAYINSIDSITFTVLNGYKEIEFGNIIIDSDPSQMVEQNIQDVFVFRNLEKEQLVQEKIQNLAKTLLDYNYKSQTPTELKEKHTPSGSADPRRFIFPFQIGYAGSKKEGYFRPNEDDDTSDSEDDSKVFFEL